MEHYGERQPIPEHLQERGFPACSCAVRSAPFFYGAKAFDDLIFATIDKEFYQMKTYNVAVIGATGMVGQRFCLLLENHLWFRVVALAAPLPRPERPTAKRLRDAGR